MSSAFEQTLVCSGLGCQGESLEMPNEIVSRLVTLRERNLFPSVSDKTIGLIASEGRLRDYAVDATVFREGDAARTIYIVLARHIAVSGGTANRTS